LPTLFGDINQQVKLKKLKNAKFMTQQWKKQQKTATQ